MKKVLVNLTKITAALIFTTVVISCSKKQSKNTDTTTTTDKKTEISVNVKSNSILKN